LTPNTGVALIVSAGLLAGVSVLPMKYATLWKFENVWLLYNALALLVVPLCFLTFGWQQALSTYKAVPTESMILLVALGVGWGVGCILCGIGYTMLGVGVGMSVVLGVAAVTGSVLPLLIAYPGQLVTAQSMTLFWSISVLLVGLALTARAGNLREISRPVGSTTDTADITSFGKGRLSTGVLIALMAGILSGLFNLGLVYGFIIRKTALRLGASSALAINIVWFPLTAGGFFSILIYCCWRIARSNSWSRYWTKGSFSHWSMIAIMALLYSSSIWLYGFGASRAGSMGAVFGFPSYMSSVIIAGNAAGALTGEWAGVPSRAWLYAAGGLIALVASIVLVSQVNLAVSQ